MAVNRLATHVAIAEKSPMKVHGGRCYQLRSRELASCRVRVPDQGVHGGRWPEVSAAPSRACLLAPQLS
eukprot:820657-Pleurochrysis_carterae.AAC.1